MDKILTSYSCECGCNPVLPHNLLKITAGNDFSMNIQLTEKQGDVWVQYDMNNAEDVIVSVVSPNGTPTELEHIIESSGKITAIVDAQKLHSYVVYGLEVIWKDENGDKRASADNVFAFVNSSVEATDSAYEYTSYNPYEFNIRMMNDVAFLSIGEIPDMTDYYNKHEIDETLNSYATAINNAGDHIDGSTAIAKTLTLTNAAGDTISSCNILAFKKYITSTGWEIRGATSSGLIDRDSINELYTLGDTVAGLTNDIASYINNGIYDSSSHQIQLRHNDTIISYIDASPFIIDGMVENVVVENSYLVISFNTDAGKQDISIPISEIFDANEYYTKTEIDAALSSYVTESELSNCSYATTAYVAEALANVNVDLSSYVTYEDIDNYNNATATALTYHTRDIYNLNSYFGNYYDKTTSDARYASNSQISANYVSNGALDNATYATSAALNDLNDRVTYIEQNGSGGTVPTDVVICYDATYIYMLTQSEYDDLESNGYLDTYTFYYITDTYSYYVTQEELADALAYVTVDLSAYVSKDELDAASYVSCSYADEITLLTQQEYDDLENNSQLDVDTLYYITDSSSNYVSSSSIKSIWTGSQNDYNNLTPDAYTLYIII